MNNRTIKGFPMKNLINTITLIFIVLFSFSGCAEKANFEDKDLSKFFILNNKDNLKRVNEIWVLELEDESPVSIKKSSLDTLVNTTTLNIEDCKYTMIIDSSGVFFRKSNIMSYGKEYMYKQAQKCFDSVINELEKEEQKRKQIDESQLYNEKLRNENLNKKFDESRIINDK